MPVFFGEIGMRSPSPRTLRILVAFLATIAAVPLTAGRAFNLTRPLPQKTSAAFNPSTIALNETTSLIITITNPNEGKAVANRLESRHGSL